MEFVLKRSANNLRDSSKLWIRLCNKEAERLCQIRVSPHLIPSSLSCKESFAVSKIMEYGWYASLLQFRHHDTVHHRHHDITDYNIRNAAQCLFKPCSPLAASPHFKIVRRRFTQYNHRCPYYLPLSAEYAYHYAQVLYFLLFRPFHRKFSPSSQHAAHEDTCYPSAD